MIITVRYTYYIRLFEINNNLLICVSNSFFVITKNFRVLNIVLLAFYTNYLHMHINETDIIFILKCINLILAYTYMTFDNLDSLTHR